MIHLYVALSGFGLDVPGPNGSTPPPGVGDKFATLLSWATWIGAGLAVEAVIAGAGMLAWSHHTGRGMQNEAMGKIVMACVGAILLGAAPGIIKALAP